MKICDAAKHIALRDLKSMANLASKDALDNEPDSDDDRAVIDDADSSSESEV